MGATEQFPYGGVPMAGPPPAFAAAYSALPPTRRGDAPTVSNPFSIGLSFTGHPATYVEGAGGAVRKHSVAAGSGEILGGEPLAWVRVDEPFECVEVDLGPALRREVAEELRAPAAAELGEVAISRDPVLWAAAVRLRADALGGLPLSDLEADQIVRTLLGHLVCEHFGGRPPRSNGRPMDRRRLAAVLDFIDAHLDETLTTARLAEVAAMSPFHFIRTFHSATSLTPHAFATARRMERARALLDQGRLTKAEVAARVGYRNAHQFRRSYASYHGAKPGHAVFG